MTPNNLLAWSLQIGALVTVAGITATVLRLRLPGARLLYWQLALLACLALPLVRPWRQPVIDMTDSVTAVSIVRTTGAPASHHIAFSEGALWLLAAGIAIRALWLLAGFWRLRRYRRHSVPYAVRNGISLRLSDAVTSPVTFGFHEPVVLLPAQFPSFDVRVQEAILCHELLHIRRRDWLFTVGEEIVRALLWFHPAIWWVLGEIGLAREQEVDRQVVGQTLSRDEYVDALLAIAGATPQLDLAPAPLFLRKRHLKHRVLSILKEVPMSKTRLVSSLAAALGMLTAACWLVTATFPLAGAPQIVADAPGVTVDLGGATLMHRTAVDYPAAAREKGIQGALLVQVKLDGNGNVSDAQVLSGPEELRNPVLSAVLNWHFAKDSANAVRQLTINFQAGTASQTRIPNGRPTPPPPPLPGDSGQTLKSINVEGLSDQARADLLARLPVHEGDTLTSGEAAQAVQAIRDFDEHLISSFRQQSGGIALNIQLPDAAGRGGPQPFRVVPAPTSEPGPASIQVGGNMQSTKLISKARPIYPPLAKEARIQGSVKLLAQIGKDGTIQDLTVISGHPLLVPAALEAVKQWVYSPTLLNGQPVGVTTEIDVNFTLAQ